MEFFSSLDIQFGLENNSWVIRLALESKALQSDIGNMYFGSITKQNFTGFV